MSEKVVAYLTRQSILASICILLSLFCCPVFPEALPTTTSSLSNDALLPVKPMKWENADKLERAQELSGWVRRTLEQNQVQAAVLARKGHFLVTLFDRTGMTHSGLVFRHPVTGEWITYSLYSNPDTNARTALLWRQNLLDFYYGQPSKRRKTLVLIPSRALQAKLLSQVYHQPFIRLLPPDHRYNLVAPVESPVSFNCTKWILLHVYAAQTGRDDIPQLLRVMQQQSRFRYAKPNWLARAVLKRKPDVNWSELNPPSVIHTVTVYNLSHSPLFEKYFLYDNGHVTSGKVSGF